MTIQYYQDLRLFKLEKLKYRLQHSILIPSHQVLLEEINQRFTILDQNGIANLEILSQKLGNKKRLEHFALENGIPKNYLEILIRHIGIYRPKPNLLVLFPDVDAIIIQKLAQVGIKNTMQLLENACTEKLRARLSTTTGIPLDLIHELACLSDLSRAGYVGPVFARLLYSAGAQNIRILSGLQADDLFNRSIRINQEKQYYKGKYQLKDIGWCIEVAGDLPIILE